MDYFMTTCFVVVPPVVNGDHLYFAVQVCDARMLENVSKS